MEPKVRIYEAIQYPDLRWMCVASKTPPDLSTIIMDQQEKGKIINGIQNYPNAGEWEQCQWIPNRRLVQPGSFVNTQQYLLTGPSGTGKSKLCLAIAGLKELDIYTFTFFYEEAFTILLQTLPPRCVILIKLYAPSVAFIAGILLFIEKINAADNRILILTSYFTNQSPLLPERIQFSLPDWCAIQKPFLAFYIPDHPEDLITKLSVIFADLFPLHHYSAKQINGFLEEYRDIPTSSVRDIPRMAQLDQHLKINYDDNLSDFHVKFDGDIRFELYKIEYGLHVGAVIFEGPPTPRVLLEQYASGGRWEIPSNFVEEADKTLFDAMGRVIQQETGLQLVSIDHDVPLKSRQIA
ncbi:hypothetical protein BP00DRAFT_499495 [Aspergillus indologenus CBS 114.80]|uniref:ATPase AAA-type core domain-containing protein n=1 Tax=Aspergillus indologenus CBS 114.80 TaxID=1450541 RepID=A0A2V5HNP3_9EURO|nr:hypothetical protein BP00DRAFT_499495 [Aspergillus indologenus CBS 114.80]